MTEKKKNGGVLVRWQLHTLWPEINERILEVIPDIKTDKLYLLSGTVKEDPTGRWIPGYHMRSSHVISVDRENGIVETVNTIYHVEGEEGDDVLGGDIGLLATRIFY